MPSLASRIVLFLSLLVPVALQVQVDLLASADYIGLRINIADLLLPFAGLGIALSLLFKQSQWPAFKIKYAYGWLTALTLILTVALFHGYYSNGAWSDWALINKYVGWLTLLSLFMWGGWVATNAPPELIRKIMQIFAMSGLALLGLGMAVVLLKDFGVLPVGGAFDYPLSGFMSNRNAYAFFVACLSVVLAVFHFKQQPLVPVWAITAFFFLLPLAHTLIGSRAGWFLHPVILIGLICFGRKEALKILLLPLLAGIALVAALAATHTIEISRNKQFRLISQMKTVVEEENLDFTSPETQQKYRRHSDAYRIQAAHDAIALWKTSPVIGAGLGTFLEYQAQRYGQFMDVVDNSPLWLLSETGLIGLMVFFGFYGFSVYGLIRAGDPLSLSLVGVLLAFGLFCLLHEMLYTRFLWFFLGLALGLKSVVADEGSKATDVGVQRI